MAEETIFTNSDFTGGEFQETSELSLATRFHVTEAGNAKRARFFAPGGGIGGAGPLIMRLHRQSDAALLATASFATWTDGAWNEQNWQVGGVDSLVPLAINTVYSTAYYTPARYVASTGYTWPKVSGGLHIESESPGGFFGTGTGMPGGTFGGNNYYADCVVEFGAGTTPVSQTFDLRWRSRALVSVNFDIPWRVRQQVQATTDIRWRSYNQVSKSVDLQWRSYQQVSASTDLRWRVFSAVQQSIDMRWRVYNQVQQLFDLRWRTAGNVSASFDIPWRVYSSVAATTDIRWRVYTSVQKDVDFRWRVYNSVQKVTDVRWITYGRVYRSWSMLWNVDGQNYTYTNRPVRVNRLSGPFTAVRGPQSPFRVNR